MCSFYFPMICFWCCSDLFCVATLATVSRNFHSADKKFNNAEGRWMWRFLSELMVPVGSRGCFFFVFFLMSLFPWPFLKHHFQHKLYIVYSNLAPVELSVCLFIMSNIWNVKYVKSIATFRILAGYTCSITVMLCVFLYRRNARHLGEDEDPLTQCVRQGGV